MRRRIEVVDTNALPDLLGRVASLLNTSWATLQDVHKDLKAQGLTEYDIYLTVKGAAIIWPHVKEALDDATPDTQRSPIHD